MLSVLERDSGNRFSPFMHAFPVCTAHVMTAGMGRVEGGREKKGGKEGERDAARPVYQLPSLFHKEAVALKARLTAVAILHSFHTHHRCSKRP